MAGPLGHFVYVSDDGNSYKLKMDASNAAVGGGVAATTETEYRRGWYPRYILAESSAGKRRKVPICDPASGVWTGATATVALEEVGVTGTVTYTVTGRFGEQRTSRG